MRTCYVLWERPVSRDRVKEHFDMLFDMTLINLPGLRVRRLGSVSKEKANKILYGVETERDDLEALLAPFRARGCDIFLP